MILSRSALKIIKLGNVVIPEEALFHLPEKVLQFGTGVLLRGLPDYFIDKANRQGIFHGRVVVVKSTVQGDASAFEQQDGMYTLCVRGLENGQKVEENIINASISRVLNANTQWQQVLDCAYNPNIQIIISNTTEVGIQLVQETILQHPPASYPGKLLAFLYERFRAFNGSHSSGLVILPTELIPDNGKKLKSIILELASLNGLESHFIEWMEQYNHFCSTLVDRIVPGKPDTGMQATLEKELGYTDQLNIMSEVYRLWAIEGDEHVKNCLSFAQADEGVIITPDIDIYRELKLRLLNGTHTLSCGLAFLAGFGTVKEAMDDEVVSTFISSLMLNELAPSIPYQVDLNTARAFGHKVLERFRNPYIQHQWINITMQYSSKMKVRCIPILLKHYQYNKAVPELFALGFAAYLFFMKVVKHTGGKFYGEFRGEGYPIQDDQAGVFYKRWTTLTTEALVEEVLRDKAFWGVDLLTLPGFCQSVTDRLKKVMHLSAEEVIKAVIAEKEVT